MVHSDTYRGSPRAWYGHQPPLEAPIVPVTATAVTAVHHRFHRGDMTILDTMNLVFSGVYKYHFYPFLIFSGIGSTYICFAHDARFIIVLVFVVM